MANNESVSQFVENAKSRGASDETIVGLLRSRGWPEKDAYAALASHYEKLTGLEVPSRKGSGTAARDAFFYLLIFATLATWTIAVGSLAFDLIDRWIPDNVFQQQWQASLANSNIASELAAIFVSFPIFLLISRSAVRDTREHPDKLNSPVRKWLTYLALVLTASIFIGDLITILTFLLKGELTSHFVAKSVVVLILSGGVFFYYFGGMKKSDDSEPHETWNRERWMAALSTLAVTVMIILGFLNIGPPKRQRYMRADARRIQELSQLSGEIRAKWNNANHMLPANLDGFNPMVLHDPETRKPYEYTVRDSQRFALCADFQLDSDMLGQITPGSFWSYHAGHHCFEFDAEKPADTPPMLYFY